MIPLYYYFLPDCSHRVSGFPPTPQKGNKLRIGLFELACAQEMVHSTLWIGKIAKEGNEATETFCCSLFAGVPLYSRVKKGAQQWVSFLRPVADSGKSNRMTASAVETFCSLSNRVIFPRDLSFTSSSSELTRFPKRNNGGDVSDVGYTSVSHKRSGNCRASEEKLVV